MNVPEQGLIFWPVGCGDSTTIRVNDEVFIQVDLNHMVQADDEDCGSVAVIDELTKILPKKGGKPYLAVFALTHQDLDHCRGFEELLSQVEIGELWFTPRVFSENEEKPSDEAMIFAAEAIRRVEETIKRVTKGESVPSGDRVRIIGYSDILTEDEYKGFPENRLSVPGTEVTELDGVDYSGEFRAFIHAPFKDDADGERNETSLAFQLKLISDSGGEGFAMLLGDHAYPVVKRIFTVTSEKDYLKWNVLLSPHHCSKKVMYFKDAGDDEEVLKSDVMDLLETNQCDTGYIVASCNPFRELDEPGNNPPHLLARSRYEEISRNGFHCTHEHAGDDCGEPIVFELGADGFTYVPPGKKAVKKESASLASAVAAARGASEPPKTRVGFGTSEE